MVGGIINYRISHTPTPPPPFYSSEQNGFRHMGHGVSVPSPNFFARYSIIHSLWKTWLHSAFMDETTVSPGWYDSRQIAQPLDNTASSITAAGREDFSVRINTPPPGEDPFSTSSADSVFSQDGP